MMIDEAIREEQALYDIAKDKYEKLGIKNCLKRMEEHKQYIEWLEELKFLRQWKSDIMDEFCKYDCNSVEEARHNGYNNAIDDFAVKLNVKCEGMIKDEWNSNVAPISWAEAYADFKDDIDEIAEQLKAGD